MDLSHEFASMTDTPILNGLVQELLHLATVLRTKCIVSIDACSRCESLSIDFVKNGQNVNP